MASVLVVEDEPNTLLAVTSLLEVTGHEEVRTATNGVEALERIHEETPELMLMDLMMPEMDGIELLKRLRAGVAPRPGHIIVMSAHADANDQNSVGHLGADQFLAKPFTLSELQSALQTAGFHTPDEA